MVIDEELHSDMASFIYDFVDEMSMGEEPSHGMVNRAVELRSRLIVDEEDFPELDEETVEKVVKSICGADSIGAWCTGCPLKSKCDLYNLDNKV